MIKFDSKRGEKMIFCDKESTAILKNELFCDLTEEKLKDALLFFDAHKKEYKKGECLCAAGDAFSRFGLVLTGTVQAFFDDINGERVIMASVTAGGTFGESLCYLGEKNSPVSIFADTDTAVLWLSCDAFSSDVCGDALKRKISQRFTRMLAHKALSMNDRVQILSKLTLREKLETYFSQCVRDYKSRTFQIPLDRESLALYLGTNRSALSRELSNMQKEGLIEFYKNSFKIL